MYCGYKVFLKETNKRYFEIGKHGAAFAPKDAKAVAVRGRGLRRFIRKNKTPLEAGGIHNNWAIHR